MSKDKFDHQFSDRLYDFVEQYISQTHRFPSIEDIAKGLKEKKTNKCHRYVNLLVSASKLSYIFRSGKPMRSKVVAPKRIVDILVSTKPQPPSWIGQYGFPSKSGAIAQQQTANARVEQYDQFESMLWLKHRPLVLAVMSSLRWLGFSVELKEEMGDHDLEISDGAYYAIAEVTGSEKSISIEDASSLSRYYLKVKYDKQERALDIRAILIGNPFHHLDPKQRGAPFTDSVVRSVRKELSHISLMTTYDLYLAIGEAVQGSKKKDEVRELFKSGKLNFQV